MFEYKGYTGTIDTADTETGLFTGSIVGIQDVVTFEGKTIPALQKAFHDSVDDYFEFCKELKELPEKPYSGRFVLRLTPDLHRRVSEAADAAHVSLNSWIVAAVEQRLSGESIDSSAMPFEDMERLAHCVAAILAEKQPSRASQSPRAKARPTSKAGSSR